MGSERAPCSLGLEMYGASQCSGNSTPRSSLLLMGALLRARQLTIGSIVGSLLVLAFLFSLCFLALTRETALLDLWLLKFLACLLLLLDFLCCMPLNSRSGAVVSISCVLGVLIGFDDPKLLFPQHI